MPAAAEIRIALAAPLSGPQAPVGRALEHGLAAAIRAANTAGGVLGEPLALVVQDDGCQRATGEGAASALVALAPAVVIGHPCSSAAVGAAALYAKAGVPFIAVGARHPDVTKAVPGAPALVFRLAGRDDRQGQDGARWLAAHAPTRRVAIVQDRTAYARAITDGALAALKARGFQDVAVLALTAGKPDYSDLVLKLEDLKVDAFLFAGYPAEAAVIVQEIVRRGLAVSMLGSDSLATGAFADLAQRTATTIRVLLPSEPMPSGVPGHADDGFDGDGVDDDEAVSARGAAALEAWIGAVQRAGSREAFAVAQALRDGPLPTHALGPIRFDANGDLVADAFKPASARDGDWVHER